MNRRVLIFGVFVAVVCLVVAGALLLGKIRRAHTFVLHHNGTIMGLATLPGSRINIIGHEPLSNGEFAAGVIARQILVRDCLSLEPSGEEAILFLTEEEARVLEQYQAYAPLGYSLCRFEETKPFWERLLDRFRPQPPEPEIGLADIFGPPQLPR